MEKKIEITAVDNFSDILKQIQGEQTSLYDDYIKLTEKAVGAAQKERAERLKSFSEQKQQIKDLTNRKLEALKEESKLAKAAEITTYSQNLSEVQTKYKQDIINANKLVGKNKEKAISIAKKEYYGSLADIQKIRDTGIGASESEETNKRKEILGESKRVLRSLEMRERREFQDVMKEERKDKKEQADRDKQFQKEQQQDEKNYIKKERQDKKDRGRFFRGAWGVGETGINASITGIGQSLSQGNVYGAAVNAGGAVGSSIASMIPFVGGIVGTAVSAVTQVLSTALNAAKQTEESRILTSNLTGRGAAGGLSFMSEAESGGLFTSIAKQRGRGGYREIRNMLELERKIGYSTNELGGSINRFERLMPNDKSSETLMKDFLRAAAKSKLWDVDKEDFSSIGTQVTAGLVPLLQREAELSDRVTGKRSIFTQTQFAKLGGGWADAQIGAGRVQAIDQMIRNPQSQFADMLIKSAILKNNPSTSLMGMMDIQAQGVMNMGTFGTTLGMVKNLSPEMQHIALMNLLPNLKGNFQARESLLQNADLFSGGMSETDIEQTLTKRGVKKDIVSQIMKNATIGEQGNLQLEANRAMVKLGDTIVPLLREHLPKLSDIVNYMIKIINLLPSTKNDQSKKKARVTSGEDLEPSIEQARKLGALTDPEFKEFYETGDIKGLTKEQLKFVTETMFKEISGNYPVRAYTNPLEQQIAEQTGITDEKYIIDQLRLMIKTLQTVLTDNKAFKNNRLVQNPDWQYLNYTQKNK